MNEALGQFSHLKNSGRQSADPKTGLIMKNQISIRILSFAVSKKHFVGNIAAAAIMSNGERLPI
jgi:hypothetical protein